MGHSRNPEEVEARMAQIEEQYPDIVHADDDHRHGDETYSAKEYQNAWQSYQALKQWLSHLLGQS